MLRYLNYLNSILQIKGTIVEMPSNPWLIPITTVPQEALSDKQGGG